MGRRSRGLVAVAVVAGIGVGAAGCSTPGARRADAATEVTPAATRGATVAAVGAVRFAPAAALLPSGHATVTTSAGVLTKVTATTGRGERVTGYIGTERRTWTSRGYLPVNSTVTVRATVRGASGKVTTSTHVYSTVAARDTEKVSFTPSTGQTVGVAMPIVADFDNRVTDRAAVERRLVVSSSPAVQGSWHWMSDHEVVYRPATYWPSGTQVKVSGDLRGVQLSKGVWGVNRAPLSFRVGADNEDTVDIGSHTLVATTAGRTVRTIPVTTGRPGNASRVGVKVIISQERTTRMDASTTGVAKDSPDYYNLTVHSAQRLTYSGEYLHAAPWSQWAQGHQNVSHGCTGMSEANAAWLMAHSQIGDPVRFVNGSRPLEDGNGWTMWNMSYARWKAGSALQ